MSKYCDCNEMAEDCCSCDSHQKKCTPKYPCQCCCAGVTGPPGKSAYEIALDNGFVGTEAEWLESLKGEPGSEEPFLSSYIEAVGSTQNIGNGENVVFDTDPDILDTVGSDIVLDSTGTVFTITSPGLYHVEWSMNISSASNPVLVGLSESDTPISALSNNALVGNYSSGALISVSEADLPYTISLQNYGAPLGISNPRTALNTAVSIRISRFADGPNN